MFNERRHNRPEVRDQRLVEEPELGKRDVGSIAAGNPCRQERMNDSAMSARE